MENREVLLKYGKNPVFYSDHSEDTGFLIITSGSAAPSSILMMILRHPLCGLRILIVLAFSRSFRLFLTSYAGLFIMLSFTDLLLNTSLCAVSFESA